MHSYRPGPAAAVATADAIPAALALPSGYGEKQRPIHRFEGERVALVELRRVLSLVQAGKVRVQEKSRRPTDAATRLIAKSLVVPDFEVEVAADLRKRFAESAGPIRAHAWAVLMQQCGWCTPRSDVLALTKAGKDLLGGVSPEAFRAGFERFLRDDQFDELNRIPNIRGQSGKGKRYMTRPPASRMTPKPASSAAWPASGIWRFPRRV